MTNKRWTHHLLAGLIALFCCAAAVQCEEATETEVERTFRAAVQRVDDMLGGLPPDAVARVKATAASLLDAREHAETAQQEASARVSDRQREILDDLGKAQPETVEGSARQEGALANGASNSDARPPEDPVMDRPAAVTELEIDERLPEALAEPSWLTGAEDASAGAITPIEREALVAEGARTFARSLSAAQSRFGVRSDFLLCVMKIESDFEPRATSRAGAVGLMQLMPSTAEELGANPWDLSENIAGGAQLIDELLDRYEGDVILAMAAYNAGPGAVAKYGGVPPYQETQAYVARVLRECPPPRP